MSLSRRALLIGGAGVASAAAAWITVRSRRAPDLPRALIDCPEDQVLELAARRLREGLPADALFAAIFVAPILYGADDEDVHAQLLVPAARTLYRRCAGPERHLPLLFALWNVNTWVRSARGAPATTPASPPPGDAAAALLDAVRSARAAEAEAAAIALLSDRKRAAEALRVCAALDFADPHRAIYVAQSLRALEDFGWDDAEPIVRSVARFLAKPSTDSRTKPEPAIIGDRDESGLVLPALRSSDVPAVLSHRASERALWDAARAAAFEAACVDENARGIHAVTLTNALRATAASAIERDTRLILLRRALESLAIIRGQLPREVFFLESLGEGDAGAPRLVAQRANDIHSFKYGAALEEEATLASASLRPKLLATVELLVPREGAWPQRDRAEAIARELSPS